MRFVRSSTCGLYPQSGLIHTSVSWQQTRVIKANAANRVFCNSAMRGPCVLGYVLRYSDYIGRTSGQIGQAFDKSSFSSVHVLQIRSSCKFRCRKSCHTQPVIALCNFISQSCPALATWLVDSGLYRGRAWLPRASAVPEASPLPSLVFSRRGALIVGSTS